MRTFYTADTHFGHASIIKHCNRPFESVEEMDATIISNWNAIVGRNDRVVHLGDFAYRCDEKRLRAIFSKLNGHKWLVAGNHDDKPTIALPWAAAPREILEVKDDGVRVVCCHYGLRTWRGRGFRGALHLFGHSHGRLAGTSESQDVGVDVWAFMPVELATIRMRMATSPPPADPEGDLEPEAGGLQP